MDVTAEFVVDLLQIRADRVEDLSKGERRFLCRHESFSVRSSDHKSPRVSTQRPINSLDLNALTPLTLSWAEQRLEIRHGLCDQLDTVEAIQIGKCLDDLLHMCRLVSFAAKRDRCEIGAVGLGQ